MSEMETEHMLQAEILQLQHQLDSNGSLISKLIEEFGALETANALNGTEFGNGHQLLRRLPVGKEATIQSLQGIHNVQKRLVELLQQYLSQHKVVNSLNEELSETRKTLMQIETALMQERNDREIREAELLLLISDCERKAIVNKEAEIQKMESMYREQLEAAKTVEKELSDEVAKLQRTLNLSEAKTEEHGREMWAQGRDCGICEKNGCNVECESIDSFTQTNMSYFDSAEISIGAAGEGIAGDRKHGALKDDFRSLKLSGQRLQERDVEVFSGLQAKSNLLTKALKLDRSERDSDEADTGPVQYSFSLSKDIESDLSRKLPQQFLQSGELEEDEQKLELNRLKTALWKAHAHAEDHGRKMWTQGRAAGFHDGQLAALEDLEQKILQARQQGCRTGKAEGHAEGVVEGRAIGLSEGRDTGRLEGIADGIKIGKEEMKQELALLQQRIFDAETALMRAREIMEVEIHLKDEEKQRKILIAREEEIQRLESNHFMQIETAALQCREHENELSRLRAELNQWQVKVQEKGREMWARGYAAGRETAVTFQETKGFPNLMFDALERLAHCQKFVQGQEECKRDDDQRLFAASAESPDTPAVTDPQQEKPTLRQKCLQDSSQEALGSPIKVSEELRARCLLSDPQQNSVDLHPQIEEWTKILEDINLEGRKSYRSMPEVQADNPAQEVSLNGAELPEGIAAEQQTVKAEQDSAEGVSPKSARKLVEMLRQQLALVSHVFYDERMKCRNIEEKLLESREEWLTLVISLRDATNSQNQTAKSEPLALLDDVISEVERTFLLVHSELSHSLKGLNDNVDAQEVDNARDIQRLRNSDGGALHREIAQNLLAIPSDIKSANPRQKDDLYAQILEAFTLIEHVLKRKLGDIQGSLSKFRAEMDDYGKIMYQKGHASGVMEATLPEQKGSVIESEKGIGQDSIQSDAKVASERADVADVTKNSHDVEDTISQREPVAELHATLEEERKSSLQRRKPDILSFRDSEERENVMTSGKQDEIDRLKRVFQEQVNAFKAANEEHQAVLKKLHLEVAKSQAMVEGQYQEMLQEGRIAGLRHGQFAAIKIFESRCEEVRKEGWFQGRRDCLQELKADMLADFCCPLKEQLQEIALIQADLDGLVHSFERQRVEKRKKKNLENTHLDTQQNCTGSHNENHEALNESLKMAYQQGQLTELRNLDRTLKKLGDLARQRGNEDEEQADESQSASQENSCSMLTESHVGLNPSFRSCEHGMMESLDHIGLYLEKREQEFNVEGLVNALRANLIKQLNLLRSVQNDSESSHDFTKEPGIGEALALLEKQIAATEEALRQAREQWHIRSTELHLAHKDCEIRGSWKDEQIRKLEVMLERQADEEASAVRQQTCEITHIKTHLVSAEGAFEEVFEGEHREGYAEESSRALREMEDDTEQAREDGIFYGKGAGREEGLQEGQLVGFEKGFETGKAEGLELGRSQASQEGIQRQRAVEEQLATAEEAFRQAREQWQTRSTELQLWQKHWELRCSSKDEQVQELEVRLERQAEEAACAMQQQTHEIKDLKAQIATMQQFVVEAHDQGSRLGQYQILSLQQKLDSAETALVNEQRLRQLREDELIKLQQDFAAQWKEQLLEYEQVQRDCGARVEAVKSASFELEAEKARLGLEMMKLRVDVQNHLDEILAQARENGHQEGRSSALQELDFGIERARSESWSCGQQDGLKVGFQRGLHTGAEEGKEIGYARASLEIHLEVNALHHRLDLTEEALCRAETIVRMRQEGIEVVEGQLRCLQIEYQQQVLASSTAISVQEISIAALQVALRNSQARLVSMEASIKEEQENRQSGEAPQRTRRTDDEFTGEISNCMLGGSAQTATLAQTAMIAVNSTGKHGSIHGLQSRGPLQSSDLVRRRSSDLSEAMCLRDRRTLIARVQGIVERRIAASQKLLAFRTWRSISLDTQFQSVRTDGKDSAVWLDSSADCNLFVGGPVTSPHLARRQKREAMEVVAAWTSWERSLVFEQKFMSLPPLCWINGRALKVFRGWVAASTGSHRPRSAM